MKKCTRCGRPTKGLQKTHRICPPPTMEVARNELNALHRRALSEANTQESTGFMNSARMLRTFAADLLLTIKKFK